MSRGISPVTFTQVNSGAASQIDGAVPIEERIILYVNGVELVALMCTPTSLEDLALGFLYNEGLLDSLGDVADVRVCGSGRCVDVWLNHDVEMPTLRTITSGCSGGTTFENLVEARHPVVSDIQISASQVTTLLRRLLASADLYHAARGIHTSALAQGSKLLCTAHDVGRHNTVDKITGYCLQHDMPMRDRILLTSGRVSSEMLNKAARMGVPVVISHTSPTSLSIELARAWDITFIGYARGQNFRLYAGGHRLMGLQE